MGAHLWWAGARGGAGRELRHQPVVNQLSTPAGALEEPVVEVQTAPLRRGSIAQR